MPFQPFFFATSYLRPQSKHLQTHTHALTLILNLRESSPAVSRAVTKDIACGHIRMRVEVCTGVSIYTRTAFLLLKLQPACVYLDPGFVDTNPLGASCEATLCQRQPRNAETL
jgi:hypothetical protein